MAGIVDRILIYIDGSEESVAAVQYGICMAKNTGAELFAAYVVNTRALNDLVKARIFLDIEEEEYKRDLDADADRYLNHAKKLAKAKEQNIEVFSEKGSVHEILKDLVDKHRIDLLIIGELPQIRSRRDEFFSETERAMRSVSCSVLIVKNEDRVWDKYEIL
jgi:nucleotide-binding universal stress UspA family protein